jgi:hypothetical protein
VAAGRAVKTRDPFFGRFEAEKNGEQEGGASERN